MRKRHFISLSIPILISLSLQNCVTTGSYFTKSQLSSSASTSKKNADIKKDEKADKAQKNAQVISLANQYARDGLFREAIASFKKYLMDNPGDLAAHRTLGIVYVKSGSYKLAIKHMQEALPLFKDDFELNYYLGEAFRTQNQYADAIYFYRQCLQKNPENLSALKALSWSYYSIRYYSEALKIVKQLKKQHPNDFQVAIIQSRIMNKIGMNDKALTILAKAEALASPEELPYINSVKGDILLDNGEKDKAESAYRKSLQDQPLLPGALTGLAKVLLTDQQKQDQAITYLERALRIKPNHLEASFLLGKLYEQKDPEKSLDYYQQFYHDASLDPLYQNEVAMVRQRLAELAPKNASSDNKRQVLREDLEDQL